MGRQRRQPAWRERVLAFWTGPLLRYVPGRTGVQVRLELDAGVPLCQPGATLPGGYAIVEAMAQVALRGEAPRDFSIFRLRRYEPLTLPVPCGTWARPRAPGA